MPVTRKEKFIFLLLMGFAMTAAMESYNLLLAGREWSAGTLWTFLLELPMMCAIVMAVQALIGGPLARRMARRVVTPGVDHPWKVIFWISAFTVLIMCLAMSAVATLLFKLGEGAFAAVWLKTVRYNLPFAFAWQLLIAGPSVRFAFRRLCAARVPAERA